MRVNPYDLVDGALDWAVANARGMTPPARVVCPECEGAGWMTYYGYAVTYDHATCRTCDGDCTIPLPDNHKWWPDFSTNWAAGGLIIDQARMAIVPSVGGGEWYAESFDRTCRAESCPTALIAAMRCYVASMVGDTVDVPDELVELQVG